MDFFDKVVSFGDKVSNYAGTFGQKALHSFNTIGSKALDVGKKVASNKYVQAALATDPELAGLVAGGLATGEAVLAGSRGLENVLYPQAPPPKPSYDGLQKIKKTPAIPSGAPAKPERPAWTFSRGFAVAPEYSQPGHSRTRGAIANPSRVGAGREGLYSNVTPISGPNLSTAARVQAGMVKPSRPPVPPRPTSAPVKTKKRGRGKK
jgi:hypothetical protein